VKRGLAWIGFGLATLFCAYWAYVTGFQIITVLTFGTRIDPPPSLWVLTGLYGLHLVAACVAWLIGLRGLAAKSPRGTVIGTTAAVVFSWPFLALLYVRFQGA
jgi:hypothetical protein